MSTRSRFAVAGLIGAVLAAALVGLQLHPAGSRSPAGIAVEQDQLKPNLASSTGACGVERWPVKTATDVDASLVNVGATTPTTIATMRSYPHPPSLPAANRIQPQETTVYSIDATLIEYKLETDSDYHMVIRDASGSTMITEIADPACAVGSLFLSSIQSARGEFDAKFTPTGTFKFTSVPVRVRGIGFFDFLHGQTGVAPNGIELHPVLDVQFNPAPPPPPSPPAAYTAVPPVRLLDTRTAGGGGPLGAGAFRDLTVVGVTPRAPAGTTAVVLNVTATNTTAAGYLTVYPAGATQPLASSLNWAAGMTTPNLISVAVGAGGAVTIFNAFGSVDVVVDLEGYFAAPNGIAGGEVALIPARITDTRAASGYPNAGSTLGPAITITIQIAGAGGVPASGVSAVILNVTVTNTTMAGFLTVYPKDGAFPLASNLNWTAGTTVPNRVIVPIGTGGQVSIFNSAGSTDVVVDVSGYFTDSLATTAGKQFTSVSPQRLVDTRQTGQTLGAGMSFTLPISGVGGVVPSGASAVLLNVTVTNTNAPSFLVAYPSTVSLPTASDLNWIGGQTLANMAVPSLGSAGAITFYNGAGSSDVVVDLAGWFS